jgi:hypothetical protein
MRTVSGGGRLPGQKYVSEFRIFCMKASEIYTIRASVGLDFSRRLKAQSFT